MMWIYIATVIILQVVIFGVLYAFMDSGLKTLRADLKNANETSAHRRVEEKATIRALTDRVRRLTPEGVLETLRVKEAAFDRANERIDNGIATARGLGQTAGEAAARDLIRQVARASVGLGRMPMQVLPDGGEKIIKGKVEDIAEKNGLTDRGL